jgi:protein gp37
MAMNKRFGKWPDKVTPRYDRLDVPLKTKTPTVFAIWNDLFHEDVPDRFITRTVCTMRANYEERINKSHTFLILTKRAERAQKYINHNWMSGFNGYPNIWFGLTVVNQQEADEKIPQLLQVPGHKWLSIEPCISPIDISAYIGYNAIKTNIGGIIDETDHERANSLPGSPFGRVGNRRSGENMEGEKPLGIEGRRRNTTQREEETGRTRHGVIPSGNGDVQLEKNAVSGFETGLSSLSRPDPGGGDDQSQERQETRQQARESGNSDVLGELFARGSCPQEPSGSETGWREESSSQTDGRSRSRNTLIADIDRRRDTDSSRTHDQQIGKEIRSGIPYSLEGTTRRDLEISFVVVGAETGPHRRPCNIEWVVSIVEQCRAAGVPIFVKQIESGGKVVHELEQFPPDLRVRELPWRISK